jgi:hypothetical protein
MPQLDLTTGYRKTGGGQIQEFLKVLSTLDYWERKTLSDTRAANLSYMEESATYFQTSDPAARDSIIAEITTYKNSTDRRVSQAAEFLLPRLKQTNTILDSTEEVYTQVKSIESKLEEKADYVRTSDMKSIITSAVNAQKDHAAAFSGKEYRVMDEIIKSEDELNKLSNYLRYFDYDKQMAGMQYHEDLPLGYVGSITTLLDRWDRGEMTAGDFNKILAQEREEGGLGIATPGVWKTQEDIIVEGYAEEMGRIDNQATQIMNSISPTINSIVTADFDSDERSLFGVGTVPIIAQNREGEWDIGFSSLVRNVYVLMGEWGDGNVKNLLGKKEEIYPLTTTDQLARLKELYDEIITEGTDVDLKNWALSKGPERVAMATQTLGEVMELKKLFEKKNETGLNARKISSEAKNRAIFRMPTADEPTINPDLLRFPTGQAAWLGSSNWRPEYKNLEELKEHYFEGYDISTGETYKLVEAGLIDKKVYEDMAAEGKDIHGSLAALEEDDEWIEEPNWLTKVVREIAPIRLWRQKQKREEAFVRADIEIAKEEKRRAKETIELIEEESSMQFLKNERKKLVKYSKNLNWEKLEKIANAIGVEHKGVIRKDLIKILFDTIDARIEAGE